MTGFKCYLKCFIIIAVLVVYGKCQQASGVNVCGEKIPCDNLECIERKYWCDYEIDCSDESDEKYCDTRESLDSTDDNNCTEKHFICDDGTCVPLVVLCDQIPDCLDKSDENNCHEAPDKRIFHHATLEPVENIITTEPAPKEARNDNQTDLLSAYDADGISSTVRSTVSASPTLAYHTPRITTDYYDKRTRESMDQSHHNYDSANHYGQSQNDQPIYGSRYRDNSYDTPPVQLFPTNEYWLPSHNSPKLSPTTPPPATFRGEHHDSSNTDLNWLVQRQPYPVIEPRSVLYPPNPRQLYYNFNKTRDLALPPFYFAINYTEQFGYDYQRNVQRARQWLVDRRDSSYNWGEDTPRALVALSLISNSFTSDVADNELMRKGLQAHLGLKLLRNRTESLTVARLAMYVNALHATCQNPRDFMGLDLVDILHKRSRFVDPYQPTVNPFVYLTLCLSNSYPSREDIQQLESLLAQRFSDEITKDRHILATTALACILHQVDGGGYELRTQLHRIREKVNEAIHTLVSQKNSDGSFGSIYSTAIAAQALMSTNSTYWNPKPTLDYLARLQSDDGSFGDMLSVYYSLPALSGRSLIHLRNTECGERASTIDDGLSPRDILKQPGPKKAVFYSVKVGHPETFSFSMLLTVPVNTDLYDTMRVAAFLDPRFRFRPKVSDNYLDIYEIANVPNDPERGLHWNLFVLEPSDKTVDLSRRYRGDIKTLIPRDSQELLFWYLSTA